MPVLPDGHSGSPHNSVSVCVLIFPLWNSFSGSNFLEVWNGHECQTAHALSEMQVLQGSSRPQSGSVVVKLILEERAVGHNVKAMNG